MIYDEDTDSWKHKDLPGLTFELACAELCGARHYAMRGRLCVHENKADFDRWLQKINKAQKSDGTEPEGKPSSLTALVDR